MPTITFNVTYEGSDTDIIDALGRMAAGLAGNSRNDAPASETLRGSGPIKTIATKFAGYVSRNARLKRVMLAWLKSNGKIPLKELVRISEVKKQHDYAGIGSALTRNMKKAGGPKRWYEGDQFVNGDYLYEVADELVAPLKRAFGL